MDTILTSTALQTALSNLILLVVTAAVGALSRAVLGWFKTHTSVQQFTLLQELAASAVSAAEQGAIAGFVRDRKATAIAIVNEGLKNAKITGLSAEQIDAAIEAAVKDVFNPDRQFGPAEEPVTG